MHVNVKLLQFLKCLIKSKDHSVTNTTQAVVLCTQFDTPASFTQITHNMALIGWKKVCQMHEYTCTRDKEWFHLYIQAYMHIHSFYYIFNYLYGYDWEEVGCIIYSLICFICWISRMVALFFCYHFTALFTFKGDISANAIYYLWRLFLSHYYIGRPS